MIKLLTVMLLTAVTVFAAPAPVSDAPSAHRELRWGLEAHLDGKDKAALKHFAKCLTLAQASSEDADSCRIYVDMFGKGKAKDDGASKPEARQAYSLAVAQYKKGDYVGADKNWHRCVDLSVPATAIRNDCMAAIDLLPKRMVPQDEASARNTFMEGMMFYSQGQDAKAADAWTRCAEAAPKGSGTEEDCRMGLAKLKKK
jgi:hypothetical protein